MPSGSYSCFKLTPEAQAREKRFTEALANPQDLEDGLLCVAHETVMGRLFGEFAEEIDRAALSLPAGPLPSDLPA